MASEVPYATPMHELIEASTMRTHGPLPTNCYQEEIHFSIPHMAPFYPNQTISSWAPLSVLCKYQILSYMQHRREAKQHCHILFQDFPAFVPSISKPVLSHAMIGSLSESGANDHFCLSKREFLQKNLDAVWKYHRQALHNANNR